MPIRVGEEFELVGVCPECGGDVYGSDDMAFCEDCDYEVTYDFDEDDMHWEIE